MKLQFVTMDFILLTPEEEKRMKLNEAITTLMKHESHLRSQGAQANQPKRARRFRDADALKTVLAYVFSTFNAKSATTTGRTITSQPNMTPGPTALEQLTLPIEEGK